VSFESEMGSDVENCNITASGVISREIGEINLAYMLLAQKLVKQDRAEAMLMSYKTLQHVKLCVYNVYTIVRSTK